MLRCATQIQEYVDGMSFEDFCADQKTIDASLRNLQIIGEAAGAIPETIREKHGMISWKDIRAFRNVVVHKYWRVDLDLLWDVITNKLPVLINKLQDLVTK